MLGSGACFRSGGSFFVTSAEHGEDSGEDRDSANAGDDRGFEFSHDNKPPRGAPRDGGSVNSYSTPRRAGPKLDTTKISLSTYFSDCAWKEPRLFLHVNFMYTKLVRTYKRNYCSQHNVDGCMGCDVVMLVRVFLLAFHYVVVGIMR